MICGRFLDFICSLSEKGGTERAESRLLGMETGGSEDKIQVLSGKASGSHPARVNREDETVLV